MTKQRPCDACGGTGERDVALCYCGGLADTCDGCPDCLGLGCYRERERNGSHDCPACSGRGWQSDAMPREDAEADAETHLLIAEEYATDSRVYWWREKARVYGERAAAWADVHVHFDPVNATPSAEREARWFAVEAARAAFRAVPGLRG